MHNKLSKALRVIKQKSIMTAERPTFLGGEVLARYFYARSYCRGKKVLDVGTGLGLGAEFIADEGASCVLGIDYDRDVINFISSKNKIPKVKFKYHDACDLKKMRDKFDVVLAFEIIEHLPKDKVDMFVESISGLLNDSGVLLLSTPNGLTTKYLFGKPYNPYHVKEYTGFEIENILKRYFTGVKLKGIRCINRHYLKKQSKIEKSLFYKPVYLMGHFKLVRELAAFIPKGLKETVTKENVLPYPRKEDYILTGDWKDCPYLFIYAEKTRRA